MMRMGQQLRINYFTPVKSYGMASIVRNWPASKTAETELAKPGVNETVWCTSPHFSPGSREQAQD
jgi:hypothetical protein